MRIARRRRGRAAATGEGGGSSGATTPEQGGSAGEKGKGKAKSFFGFDEEDEFMRSDDESEGGEKK